MHSGWLLFESRVRREICTSILENSLVGFRFLWYFIWSLSSWLLVKIFRTYVYLKMVQKYFFLLKKYKSKLILFRKFLHLILFVGWLYRKISQILSKHSEQLPMQIKILTRFSLSFYFLHFCAWNHPSKFLLFFTK